MASRHVASQSFEQEVLQSQRPTLVDFYADWCGPCRAVAPVLDQLAQELAGSASVVRVNVDESPELASRYGVQAIPTFVVFREGQATTTLVGIQSKQALAAAVAG